MAPGLNAPYSDLYPCLDDRASSTPFDPHYFFQAAWIARRLADRRPPTHVDVGSSVYMLSVLSAYQETTFLDYRPLQVSLPGLTCIAGTVTALPFASSSLDSVSSLHVLEHIGLGRYGDPLDPQGSARGCSELARVLSPGGRLYVSVPVGRERVCFNAHRVFSPSTIVNLLPELNLVEFSLIDDARAFHHGVSPRSAEGLEYGCGLFEFTK